MKARPRPQDESLDRASTNVTAMAAWKTLGTEFDGFTDERRISSLTHPAVTPHSGEAGGGGGRFGDGPSLRSHTGKVAAGSRDPVLPAGLLLHSFSVTSVGALQQANTGSATF